MMSNFEKKRDTAERPPPHSPTKEQSQGDHSGAEDDDITLGDEAQKLRDKRQRQEKAEGDRRRADRR